MLSQPRPRHALGRSGLSHPDRMLGGVSRSRRRLAKGIKPGQNDRARGLAAPVSPAERIARLPAAKVLERIIQARLQRDELDAELALQIDHAANLGIGWPDVARCLGVSRQAARQHYQRRHRDGTSRQDHVA
jgi:hypothetical protein